MSAPELSPGDRLCGRTACTEASRLPTALHYSIEEGDDLRRGRYFLRAIRLSGEPDAYEFSPSELEKAVIAQCREAARTVSLVVSDRRGQ